MKIDRSNFLSILKTDISRFQETHGRGILPMLYYPMFSAIILFRTSCLLYNYKTLRPFAYLLVRLNDLLNGVWIGPRVEAGHGLFFAHSRGLIVNPDTKIGNNCTIMQRVTLGGPNIKIGNNVLIGANAQIISRRHKKKELKIGNNVRIAAGSVVIHDIPDNTTVAGNPAKKVKSQNSYHTL